MHIGEMIKKARVGAGMTQDEMAKGMGTSKQWVCQMESRKSASVITLNKVARAIGKQLIIKFKEL